MPPIPRSLLLRAHARYSTNPRILQRLPGQAFRQNSTLPPQKSPTSGQKTWLARKVESSKGVATVFYAVSKLLGYDSTKQQAGRRAMELYNVICSKQPDKDKKFWQEDCSMPPTFQTWFTITNLHIWMLTVRLRALPDPLGKYYAQALVDHFFMDVEDRIRDIYQPLPPDKLANKKYYTHRSDFYVNPNETLEVVVKGKSLRVRAPDRVISRQMKIFKEQWAGMGMSMDIALVQSDQDMAAAIWRNILGARGAQGIGYAADASNSKFRRQINLVGGEVVKVSKLQVEAEETKDDGSGVHDFPPQEVDKYLKYPGLMLDIVAYVRREIYNLEHVDDQIITGDGMRWEFGKVEHIEV